jgi:exopolysaccharide biosynthesis predicted pyruvyltransferase EpsI
VRLFFAWETAHSPCSAHFAAQDSTNDFFNRIAGKGKGCYRKTYISGLEPTMSWSKRANTTLMVDFLKELRNKRVFYFPNSGNAGDSLISAATMQLFRRLNIPFETTLIEPDARNEIVVLGGGGNFIPLYETIRNAFIRYKNARQIILLPHTIRGNEDILSELGSNVTIFCREVPSYLHLQTLNLKASYYLAHDMAFHLDAEALLFSSEAALYQAHFDEALKNYNINIRSPSIMSEAHFTRSDEEATGQLSRCDADISSIFGFGVWPGDAERSSWCLLEAIRCVDKIVTDRLHVGIGSALLDKTCVLHDNSYGKNKAVYDHSLRFYSGAVTFAD